MGQVQLAKDESNNPIIITFDDAWSFKDFTNKKNINIPNNTVVYASVFVQEQLDSQIFRSDMSGVTFVKCNLSNCVVPAGNTVDECITDRFQVQEDGFDWLLDEENVPYARL